MNIPEILFMKNMRSPGRLWKLWKKEISVNKARLLITQSFISSVK